MTRIATVSLASGMGLVGYIIRGDAEDPDRIWVCVRSKNSPTKLGWLGCWSRKSVSDPEVVIDFLRKLDREIAAKAGVGPRGPWLGGIYFIPGWDAWGPGIPSPLINLSYEPLMLTAEDEVSIGQVDLGDI